MNIEELREYWLKEEQNAKITGWDFSYIEDRFDSKEDELPWNYSDVINRYRHDTDKLLDIDTGGGEFLLSLGHPYENTSATEGYPPNAELCRKKFGKLGIDFYEAAEYSNLPFMDNSFDIVDFPTPIGPINIIVFSFISLSISLFTSFSITIYLPINIFISLFIISKSLLSSI